VQASLSPIYTTINPRSDIACRDETRFYAFAIGDGSSKATFSTKSAVEVRVLVGAQLHHSEHSTAFVLTKDCIHIDQ
jgi:hypothetical protein